MADYLYDPKDKKLHTRYTELAGCTAGSMQNVVARRLGLISRFESPSMEWGTDRHEMWAVESLKTGLIPACFREVGIGRMKVEFVEREFVIELYRGVVIHLRPDAVSKTSETILDYKTATEPSSADWSCLERGERPTDKAWLSLIARYKTSRQLKFYVFMLGLHGIRLRRGVYLIEVWDKTHQRILGYEPVWEEYKLSDIAKLLPWTRDRVSLLVAAVEKAQSAV